MIRILLGLALAVSLLAACDDPHEGEHCTAYSTHTHSGTHRVGKVNRPYTYTTRDCVRWEKDR